MKSAALAAVVLAAATRPPATAQWWLTNADRSALLARQAPLAFSSAAPSGPTITVDPSTKYQAIDGFGYTLTGGSAALIARMSPTARARLLHELFARSDSALGVSYLRLTIGASDLSARDFTYDEVPAGGTDPALAHFDLFAGDSDLVPVLKQILAVNPRVAIIAAPWTAPTWMKSNRAWSGGSLAPRWYDAYARYFVKYVEAMRARGVTIAAVTPQNEPLNPNNNPSLVMTADEQRAFVRDFLGPAFRKAGLKTRIVVYDHNLDHPEYATSILDDPKAKAFVDGSAFHLYAGDVEALSRVHAAHPDRNVYFTEQYTASTGEFAGDLRWHLKNVVIGTTANWSRTALEWNLANDPGFGPHTDGGCTTCRGALTIDGDGVSRNVGYYIVGHASRFVPPGSVRVQSTLSGSTTIPNVAFVTPTGKRVLIVVNDGERPTSVSVRFAGRSATIPSLGVGSAATVVW